MRECGYDRSAIGAGGKKGREQEQEQEQEQPQPLTTVSDDTGTSGGFASPWGGDTLLHDDPFVQFPTRPALLISFFLSSVLRHVASRDDQNRQREGVAVRGDDHHTRLRVRRMVPAQLQRVEKKQGRTAAPNGGRNRSARE